MESAEREANELRERAKEIGGGRSSSSDAKVSTCSALNLRAVVGERGAYGRCTQIHAAVPVRGARGERGVLCTFVQ